MTNDNWCCSLVNLQAIKALLVQDTTAQKLETICGELRAELNEYVGKVVTGLVVVS